MNEGFALILENADYTLLLMLRVSGLLISSPVFGRRNVPQAMKIVYCLVVGYVFLHAFPAPVAPLVYRNLIEYVLVCVKEMVFGAAMGFVTTAFFNLTFVGGQMIDMQIGFGIVSVYDVQNRTQIPLIGNMLNIIMLLVFFALNAHQYLIEILYATFEPVPVGYIMLSTDLALAIAEAFSRSFLLGVMLALPMIASGMLMEVVMGAVIKSVPQINMFVVGIPLKLFVGLLMLAFMIPVYVPFCETVFTQMFDGIGKVFSTMRSAL